MSSRACSIRLCLSLLLLASAGSVDAAPLFLELKPASLSVAGVTMGGAAVVFGITREVGEDDYTSIRTHLDILKDTDRDGVVGEEVGPEVPLRSMWVAIDLASGDFAAAAPDGYRLRNVGWRGDGVQRRSSGVDRIEDARSLAEILLVRPAAGAWTLHLGDGSASDADGAADGRIAAALDTLEPLPGSPPPPDHFQSGDTILLVDPNAMELTLVKVAEARP